MTSLPADSDKQHEQTASAQARPGDESRKKLSPRLRAVETAAATVAVLVGMFYSTSSNVTIGAETDVEENLLFDPQMTERARLRQKEKKKEDEDAAKVVPIGAGQLPWLQLPPPP